jgi:hypothetical protein
MPKPAVLDLPDNQTLFLDALRQFGHVPQACQVVGISKQAAYIYRSAHPLFAEEWDAAIMQGRINLREELEQALWQRALRGTVVPVYKKDQEWEWDGGLEDDMEERHRKAMSGVNVVGFKHVPPSDKLLELALRAELPTKYAQTKLNVNVNANANGGMDEFIQMLVEEARAAGLSLTPAQAKRRLMALTSSDDIIESENIS